MDPVIVAVAACGFAFVVTVRYLEHRHARNKAARRRHPAMTARADRA